MSDFLTTWQLVRGRFDDAITGLNHEQLTWRMHPESLTLGEMAIHVAGVEVSFISQLQQSSLDGFGERLRQASTDGVVNEGAFPFGPEEMTPETIHQALSYARSMVEPVIADPDAVRDRQIKSALGPIIDGTGAFARLAYHPGYHQGQAHLIKTAPGFPAN